MPCELARRPSVLTTINNNNFVLNRTFYSAPLNDGAWHSVCVTWQKSTSTCKTYVDGKTNEKRSFDYCRGNNDVEFNGKTLVLGQSIPNDEEGLFLESHSFTGNLSRLNIWDYAMTDEHVYGVATDCSRTSGNILSWPMSQIDVKGSVVKTEGSCCIGVGELHWTVSGSHACRVQLKKSSR